MQATAYFLPDQHRAFVSYAENVGLDPAQLLRMLLLREIAFSSGTHRSCSERSSRRQRRGEAVGRIKVTARFNNPCDQLAFRKYLDRAQLGPTEAATLVALRELGERWLEPLVRGR